MTFAFLRVLGVLSAKFGFGSIPLKNFALSYRIWRSDSVEVENFRNLELVIGGNGS